MTAKQRQERLDSEYRSLVALRQASSIFEFTADGELPDCYQLRFLGRGLARSARPPQAIDFVGRHTVEMRLPYSFPVSPPDIRWTSPLFHPNVSFSGLIEWSAIGLRWHRELGMDLLCERLWDIARLERFDLRHAVNVEAARWLRRSCAFMLPVDGRPLRDRDAADDFSPARAASEILVITENTPTPNLPIRIVSPRSPSDVLYISD